MNFTADIIATIEKSVKEYELASASLAFARQRVGIFENVIIR